MLIRERAGDGSSSRDEEKARRQSEFQFYMNGSLGTSADQILGGLQSRNFESSSYNVGAFADTPKPSCPST